MIYAGSGQLKEWVSLDGHGGMAPRIRISRPMTTLRNEGTRKRRRAAAGDYMWSVGDKVDAWMQNRCGFLSVLSDFFIANSFLQVRKYTRGDVYTV